MVDGLRIGDRGRSVFAAREGDPGSIQVQRARRVADVWCGRERRGSSVFGFRNALFDLSNGLLLALTETFELLGYAGLDLEFDALCARGVRLFWLVLAANWLFSVIVLKSVWRIYTHLGVGLEVIDEVR